MNTRIKTLVIVILILLSFLVMPKLAAQEGTRLSLQQCLQRSLASNPEIQRARLEMEKNQYRIREVRGMAMPRVELNGQIDDYVSLPTQLIPGEFFGQPGELIPIKFGTQYNSSGGIDASMPLYSQQLITAVQAAREASALSSLSVDKAEENVLYQVSFLYYSLQIYLQQESNLLAALSDMDKLMKISQLQFEKGFLRKVDIDRMEVNRMNLHTELDNIRIAKSRQLSSLKFFLGMKPEEFLEISAMSGVVSDSSLLATFNVAALTDYRIFEKQRQLAMLNLRQNKEGFYPTLSAYGRYSYQSQQNEFRLLDKDTEWYNVSVVGLMLKVPVFDGFQKKNRSSQYRLDIRQLELAMDNTEKMAAADYMDARDRLRSSLEAGKRAMENQKLAGEVYRITQDQYGLGMASVVELLNAESALRASQTGYLQSIVQARLAELDVLRSTGKLHQLTGSLQ